MSYEPYGPEWKKEIKKLPKDQIIDLMAKLGKERDSYKEILSDFSGLYSKQYDDEECGMDFKKLCKAYLK